MRARRIRILVPSTMAVWILWLAGAVTAACWLSIALLLWGSACIMVDRKRENRCIVCANPLPPMARLSRCSACASDTDYLGVRW
jgi:hypothetical protein